MQHDHTISSFTKLRPAIFARISVSFRITNVPSAVENCGVGVSLYLYKSGISYSQATRGGGKKKKSERERGEEELGR